MKKIATLLVLMLGFVVSVQAQKLSKADMAKYETEINALISYLEETLNFLGDSTSSAFEKEIVFTESWNKIFIDDKVQVEDDLDVNRKTSINKDVQAYLKDIDFFFKQAQFKFDVQSISNSTRENGSIFFKVALTRNLKALTIYNENIDNNKNRFIEVNLDRQNSSLKIASIYTSKINETESLHNWWNGLTKSWKSHLGEGVMLYDSIPVEQVSEITNNSFKVLVPIVDPATGETVVTEKVFKDAMTELDSKLKYITQQQRVDVSGVREIISLEPIGELSDIEWLDISGTSIDDLTPLLNANKLKVLRADSTLINDLSPLKYEITLEELEVSNTNVDDISVLSSLRNLTKLNVANTLINRINYLKNCPNLNALNLSGCNISNIGILQDLTDLKSLDISNTAVRDIAPISQLISLQSLDISGTQVNHLQDLSALENLIELRCSNTSINDLSPLKNNRRLNKIYCNHSKIGDKEASAFTMSNPFTLVIFDTEALVKWWNNLPIYWKALFSKQLQIDGEPTTEQLHQIINMQELDLSGNTYIQNLLPVSRLTNLKSLNVSSTEIPNLFALQGLANLESLNLENTYIKDLTPLQEMINLKFLNIRNTPIVDLTPLVNDNSIETIWADSTITQKNVIDLKESQRQVTVVYQTKQLLKWWEGIDPIWQAIFREHINCQSDIPNALELQKIVDLRELVIPSEKPIIALDPIQDFIWLERLTINNQGVHDLAPLANKKYLLELNAENNPIGSLSPIEGSTMLESLNLENTQIKDLGPLSKMNNLVTLNASGTPVKSLKPLSGLQKLENLFVNNTNVKSLSPVEDIASLKQLKVYNTKVRARDIEKLQQKRLDLNIIYY